MNNVSRICPQCGVSTAIEARHCPQCGYNTQTGLSNQQNQQSLVPNNLAVALGKAALPVVVGMAGLMLRASWQLLQSRMFQDVMRYGANKATASLLNITKNAGVKPIHDSAPLARSTTNQAQPMNTASSPLVTDKSKRTIRVRSFWVVGDQNGMKQQGTSDHTIEIEDELRTCKD